MFFDVHKSIKIQIIAIALLIGLAPWSATQAYEVENLSNVPAIGDFVLEQGKTEVRLNPGEKILKPITITNRFGSDITVTVSVEDFTGSKDTEQNIDLLNTARGPYSLRDYLKPEITSFTLRHGAKLTFPVLIDIPADANPGGLYGAVIISTEAQGGNVVGSGQVKPVARLASLFFVRVNGEINENGGLKDFSSDKNIYFSGPAKLKFIFSNSGSIYLNPYGELKITDLLGRQVYYKQIAPYFVMPQTVRSQQEIFNKGQLLGLYKATLTLNRGYNNQLDQKTLYFFVLPIDYIIPGLVILLAVFWLIRRVIISFKKKQ
jgi:hypothetical protein